MKRQSLVRKHLNGQTEQAKQVSLKARAARENLDNEYETAKGRGWSDDKIVNAVVKTYGISRETAYELIASVRKQHDLEQNRVYRHSSFTGSRS